MSYSAASNFGFLQPDWPDLLAEARRAEAAAHADPRTACFYARRTLELAVAWLYRAEGGRGGSLRMPYKADLSAFLFEPSFQQLVGPAVHAKMDVIRRLGNKAVHDVRSVPAQDALAALRELFHVAFWLAQHYARRVGDRPAAGLQFRADLLPLPASTAVAQEQAASRAAQATAREALAKQAQALAERDAALREAAARHAELDAELARYRAEIAAAKAANAAQPATEHDYHEAATRDLFIDLLLKEAGWALDQKRDREFEVQGMPNGQGKGFVDYVLWSGEIPLAIVEAKRSRRSAKEGEQQARLYADCLERSTGHRPVIYGTNGYEHWVWDDTTSPPRPVQGFHTRDELELMHQRRTTRKPLARLPIAASIVERHYQQRAIRRIAETFERDQHRKALVVMATGAGKTRTVIALVDLLMRAGWAKRVLFLADRVALVNQAVNAFKAHLPDAAPVNLVTDRATEGRVYVSTYPTMMGLINEGAGSGQRRFGVGHFDLIVVDEAHRSIYQKYRAIFSYFDALLVGLTATPKDEIDRNTYSLFGLESGVPTDAYGLDDAIAEGYLAPPKAISVPLKFQREGIRYNDLSDDEKDQWDALEWDEEGGEPPDAVSAEAVNQVDKMLALLMERGHKVAGGDRLGKTIIFAKNQRHADFIAERFNANYPQYRGEFARVITFKTEYAQSLIDDFAQKDRAPHIAISVDMLDTGIDVPEVVNLVFFKIVRSKAKFWQMVGRGTRLCKDLYGPEQDKQDFFIFDFCQNLEFFSQELEGSEGALAQPLSQRLFNARLELLGVLDQRLKIQGVAEATPQPLVLTEAAIRDDTAALLHGMVAGMSLDNFVVRPQRRWVEAWAQADAWRQPTAEQLAEVSQHLSGLPTSVRDDDEDAKRFDALMLGTQLALLRQEPALARLQARVQQLANGLLHLANVPSVREHLLLIEAITGDEWWQDVTLPMLEQARRKLRSLIKLIEKTSRKVVYTDFEDALGEAAEVELPLVASAVDFERFRAKAKVFLRAHEDRLALHKLRRNQPLTVTDLQELDALLHEAGGSDGDIERARALHTSLPVFVRSLVGLDREAAAAAFAHLVAGGTASASQLQFIDEIVQHLTEHGAMPAARLYQSPFIDIHTKGPDGVFGAAQVEQLLALLQRFEQPALAASGG
ncbi:MAG: restriction endonuclease subunit R [Comamonas sp. SCN 65-56]|uniref:DEAD/DEAH box helicase family protein n=2 Tax=Comamonas TaxID=283 RepID=UPI00086F711A|nr:DEAD/DEAH box helicase family protein [Comamonas sp. SCN 65-56]ODS92675.1 MAG: restriction endonuclease subunit R [Comamonas sp. SCN 65-56]